MLILVFIGLVVSIVNIKEK
ncbi:hypothetical protein [Staphylococcus pettenkoferi]